MRKRIKSIPLCQYALLFLSILIITVIFRETGLDKEVVVKYITAIALIAVSTYFFLNRGREGITITNFILICGIILRIGYMLYTPMTVRSHDIGAISPDGDGHYGYIYKILTTGKLVDSGSGQFYHPPLFYILSAVLVKILSVFFNHDFPFMIEYAKVISCFSGCMTIIFLKRLMDELNIKYSEIPTAILSFFPNFILMSGRINNDALSVLFISLCLLYTFKWYNDKTIKNIIILALSFGFGIMSKISAGTIALFTGTIMAIELYKAIKNKNATELIKQYAVFAVICIPLALWYPIRNYILFDQSFMYVPGIQYASQEDLSAAGLREKFLSFSFWKVITRPYCIVNAPDRSLIQSLLRTSMFGEFTHEGKEVIARILATVNIVMVACSIVCAVYVLRKGKEIKPLIRFGLAFLWVIIFIPYLRLNYQIPINSTMDFRYITMTVTVGASYLALMPELRTEFLKYIWILTVLFCALSAAMYVF